MKNFVAIKKRIRKQLNGLLPSFKTGKVYEFDLSAPYWEDLLFEWRNDELRRRMQIYEVDEGNTPIFAAFIDSVGVDDSERRLVLQFHKADKHVETLLSFYTFWLVEGAPEEQIENHIEINYKQNLPA